MMNELRPILDQQMSRLEAEGELLEETIAEIQRRYSVLDYLKSVLGEVDSWKLLAPEDITQENRLRPILDQQMSQLEAERKLLEGTIAEIHRRYSVLDHLESAHGEVESWKLLAPEEITQENGKDYLSHSGEQDAESSEGTVQEKEPNGIWDMVELQALNGNAVAIRVQNMLKQE